MRIFTRYILREVLSHALLGGVLFTFVLFMRDLGSLLELVVRNSASLVSIGKIFLFMLPNMFTVTIPMSVLVGILLGLSRLAADSEITAMRAAGIGVSRFVNLVAIVAVAAWILGLANTLYFAPRATAGMLAMESSLKDTQASIAIQPRVFYEDFKNFVLYVEDVRAGTGAASWHEVFLADMSDPAAPRVTTAQKASVLNGGNHNVTMLLRNGTQHQTQTAQPDQYNVSTFSETELPLETAGEDEAHIGRTNTPMLALDNGELYRRAIGPAGKAYLIELHKRFAYPAACLVLMLVGVPLGMSSRRGGKSAGFVLTIALVFLYYFISSTGVALARQNKVPVALGVWGANLIFSGFGLMLLRQMSTGGAALAAISALGTWIKSKSEKVEAGAGTTITEPRRRGSRGHFPLILDDYVLREFLTTFALVLTTFVMLMLVFTFFELLGDIIRNRTPLVTVGEYLINLTPSMVYIITPLSVLIAVLATFGVLTRSNEITAMKATGISIYRVVVPILVIASTLAVSLFLFDEVYLPSANRKQEALRSIIKGRPAQTFARPDQKWIVGRQEPGLPPRIYYYEFFDPDHDRFANISVFEFDPQSFALTNRIFAASAQWEPDLRKWVFEHGWERSFRGDEIRSYRTFEVSTSPLLVEEPQYFKKETRQSQEMSYSELSRYIRDLRQSGFDTMRLRVQLNHKLAYPLITLVMAILALPFALSMGRRGSLTGIATAIGLALAYWVISGMFEAMGNVNMLPAFLAAWSPDLLFGLVGGYLLLRTPT